MKFLLKIWSIIFFGFSLGLFLGFSINNIEYSFCVNNKFDFNNSVSEYCETECFIAPEKVVKLNFDKIFPETQLSKIFDSCAKVYQDLDLIAKKNFFKINMQNGKNFEQELDVFTDLLVGRLFNIKVCMLKLPVFSAQDAEYLNKIFDKILFKYKTIYEPFNNFINFEKSENVEKIIEEIKSRLE